MKNILERMTNLTPDCFYHVLHKKYNLGVRNFNNILVYCVSFGDSSCVLNCYSKFRKKAIQDMIDRIFRTRRKRESEVKGLLNRLGIPDNITKDQMEIKLSLMGL